MLTAPEVTDPREAAGYLRLHTRTVQDLARDGKLPAIRIGRVWRFRKVGLTRWPEEKLTEKQPVLSGTR